LCPSENMMSSFAYIECQYHELEPFGHHYYTYKWIGKKNQPILLGIELLESKDTQDIPWKFLLIEHRIESGQWLAIRRDAILPFGWLFVVKVKCHKYWSWFKYRLIITANVWGLAHTRQGNVPSWKDFRRKK